MQYDFFLPNEMWNRIFSICDFPNLLALRNVSHHFRVLVQARLHSLIHNPPPGVQITWLLYIAVMLEDSDAITQLVTTKQIDINTKESDIGATPLHMAAYHNKCNIISFLLITYSRLIQINLPDTTGMTPLHVAVMARSHNALELFIRNKAQTDTETIGGVKPIHTAICNADLFSYQTLLFAGAVNTNPPAHIQQKYTWGKESLLR